MRSPSQHPSRKQKGRGGGFSLELELGSVSPPSAPKKSTRGPDSTRAPLPALPGSDPPQPRSPPSSRRRGTALGFADPRSSDRGFAQSPEPAQSPPSSRRRPAEPPQELNLEAEPGGAASAQELPPQGPPSSHDALGGLELSVPSSRRRGEQQLEAASSSEGQGPGASVPGEDDGLALELPAVAEPPSKPSPEPLEAADGPAAAAGATAGPDSSGYDMLQGWGDGGDSLGDIGMELESIRPGPRSEKSAAAKPRSATASQVGSGDKPSEEGRAQHQLAPSPATPSVVEVDPFEVKLLADYGAVPSNIFGTVRYTVRVFQRRKALRVLHVQQEGFFERARRRIQEKYLAIVEQVSEGASEQDEELQSLLAPIQEATQLIGDRAAQLEATREQFQAQVAKLEGELSTRGDDRQQIEAERNHAQIVLEDCLQQHARCEANLQRVRGQLSAAHDAAAAAAGEDAEFAPPEHARRIAELEGQKARLSEQLGERDSAVDEARRTVGIHDKALRELGRRVGNIHDRRRALDQQASEARDLREEGLRAAEQTRLDAFERTLRSLLQDHAQLFDDETSKAVEQLDEELEKARYDLEKHNQAINAYDDDAYKKGVVIMVVLAVCLLLALFAVARVG